MVSTVEPLVKVAPRLSCQGVLMSSGAGLLPLMVRFSRWWSLNSRRRNFQVRRLGGSGGGAGRSHGSWKVW